MEARDLQSLASDCAGVLHAAPAGGGVVRRVCTDSRAVRPGDLFVCLVGERFDGHAFAAEALQRGAVAVLGEAGRLAGLPATAPRILVPDSRTALGRMAGAHRRRFSGPVLAVAGSHGKTTTKELLAAALRTRGRVVASPASYNNDIGVPLTLLELEPDHWAAVVEVGTNHPGELAPLLEMARPTHGVLTRLGREHLEFFGDLEGVIAEEGRLASALPPEGTLVLAGDGPGAEAVRALTRARVVRVGWGAENDWQATAAAVSECGTWFTVRAPRAEWSGEYRLRLVGRHQVENALLVLAVCAALGLERDRVAAALAAAPPAPHRLEVREVAGVRLLDDTYNANPDSMRAALEVLRDVDCPGRRWAVLGDMGEQGRATEAGHVEVGRAARAAGVDCLVAVGRWAAAYAAGAGQAQRYAAGAEASAAAAVLQEVQAGDVVLVKASRAAQMERVVEALVQGLTARGGATMTAKAGEKAEACFTT